MSARTLEIVEDLASNVFGHGAAVSIDRRTDRTEVRVWDAKGAEVMKAEGAGKDLALAAARRALLSASYGKKQAKPRLGRAELAMLRRLYRASSRGATVGLCEGYDPGAEAPRRTLDALVRKDLARRLEGDPIAWTITDRGIEIIRSEDA